MNPLLVLARLPRSKGFGKRLEQRIVAERLEQALRSSQRYEARTDTGVTVRGDEHNRNRLPPACQFLLQVGSRHAGQCDVENEAVGLADELRREERLGRRECLDGEAELPQQIWQRLAHGLIVVD